MSRRTTFLALISILLLTFALTGCPNGSLLDPLRDREPPVPGENGNFTINPVSYDIMELAWAPAEDAVTPTDELEYDVFFNPITNNVGSYEEAVDAGVQSTDWIPETAVALNGLLRDTEYWVNVFVRDRAGNVASYGEKVEVTMLGPMAEVWLDNTTWSYGEPLPVFIPDYDGQIDFGPLWSSAMGGSAKTASIKIHNAGDMDLVIPGSPPATPVEGSSMFSLSNPLDAGEAIIPKETAVYFQVTANYDDGTEVFTDVFGSVSFECNDPDHPMYKFGLTAYANC
jgi:hypothetical protein